MKECPICFEKKNNMILIECNHEICFLCSKKWLLYNFTCPICRMYSKYFSRCTRSLTKALQRLPNVQSEIDEIFLSFSFNEYVSFLNKKISQNKHV